MKKLLLSLLMLPLLATPSFASFQQSVSGWNITQVADACIASKVVNSNVLKIELKKGFNVFNPTPLVLAYVPNVVIPASSGVLSLSLSGNGHKSSTMVMHYTRVNPHTIQITGFPSSLDTSKYTKMTVNLAGQMFTDSIGSTIGMKGALTTCAQQL